jgi:hypothetical protein
MGHINCKSASIIIALTLLLTFVVATPIKAGDPDKTVGGIDVSHYVCVTDDHLVVDLDNDAATESGGTLFYDKDKTVNFEKLRAECEEAEEELDINLTLEPVRQTRIEGYVYEFHLDPSAPGGWRGVPSQSVPVVASGPGFEIFWGSEKDGFFYFDNLGAGPVTFNLRLPPDAHAINPNVTITTDGFADVSSGVYLAFYRGDMSPPDIEAIAAPNGAPLPPANFTFDNPDGGDYSLNDLTGMPSVGGVLPQQPSTYAIALAVIVLIALPVAGVLKLRRTRLEN